MLAVTNTTIETEDSYTSGVYSKRPVTIVRGAGALLWDEAGREYIDCIAGHGVANIGHGRAEVAAAIAEQAQRLTTCPEILYNDTRARLLERLARLVPLTQPRIFLCNSGTEAVEGAIKFARLTTGRTGIVATLRGFHGRSMGALSATWEPHYREPFAPLVPGFTHMRYNSLDAARAAISEQTAGVLIELVQGEGGVHPATQEYISGLAEICHERGALLIVDEVQTGFGRTGRLFASQLYGVEPDILCLAKALGGGLPIGAICLGQRVQQSGRITRGAHGTTFGGNPLACAAALATLDIIEHEHLAEQAAELGAYALDRLRQIQSPLIREVRGSGLLLGIELKANVQPYLEQLLAQGILALPAGSRVLRLLPPLVISREQLDRVLDALATILGDTSPATSAATTEQMRPEVALLHDLLRIPSYSGSEHAAAHYLVEQARQLGLEAHIDEAGNFVAGAGLESSSQPLILLGHMDTVRGVVPIRIEEERLYGRGAVDAKGPLAAFLCAAARVAASGPLERPLLVIGAVEEESATSKGARAVVGRYQPLACVIGEPSGSQAVTLGYKGRLLVDGYVSRSLSHTAGPEQPSCEIAAAFWERVRVHGVTWNQQIPNASLFASLMPSLRSLNSQQDGLSETTSFTIGYRLPPRFDIADLRSQLESWASAMEISLTLRGEEQAIQCSRTTPLGRAFAQSFRELGIQPTFKLKTGTSDMNVVAPTWGGNLLAYGPGDSRLDHTPQEHIVLAEYLQAIDVLESVLRTLTQPERTTEA